MDRTLQHFNQYTTESQMDWPGLQSNRFPKPRLIHPRRDLIQSGLDFPVETSQQGRKHYETSRSQQYQFKPRLRQYRDLEHWHPRESSKKIVQLSFTQPHPRYEKGHFIEPVYQHSDKSAGIRTFYNSKLRDGQRQYSVQDRMQRKYRTNQLELRQQAFKDESFRMSQNFYKFRL